MAFYSNSNGIGNVIKHTVGNANTNSMAIVTMTIVKITRMVVITTIEIMILMITIKQ